MKITYWKNYETMSLQAGAMVVSEIERKRDLLICTATGDSPRGLYRELAVERESHASLFKHLRIIKLDEWGCISNNHPILHSLIASHLGTNHYKN